MKPDIRRVAAYWDIRPCNIRHSAAPVGTRRYFDEVEARKYHVEPHIPAFSDFARWKGRKVLEIGCGLGTAAVSFVRAGADYTGVELSKTSLDLARKRFAVYGLKGRFVLGNAENLSRLLTPERYDLVYSFGVIHHSPHPERIVAQTRKFMGPKSEFRLMLYAKNSWKNILIEAGLEQPEAQAGCPIAETYTREEATALLKGFRITRMEQTHIFPYQIDPYKRHRYKRQPWFEAMPPGMFAALERALGWHLLITCRKI